MIVVNTVDLGRSYNVISLVCGVGQDSYSPIQARKSAIDVMIKDAESM